MCGLHSLLVIHFMHGNKLVQQKGEISPHKCHKFTQFSNLNEKNSDRKLHLQTKTWFIFSFCF